MNENKKAGEKVYLIISWNWDSLCFGWKWAYNSSIAGTGRKKQWIEKIRGKKIKKAKARFGQ